MLILVGPFLESPHHKKSAANVLFQQNGDKSLTGRPANANTGPLSMAFFYVRIARLTCRAMEQGKDMRGFKKGSHQDKENPCDEPS